MRYWWVNQNQTYKQELGGGYLPPRAMSMYLASIRCSARTIVECCLKCPVSRLTGS